MAIYGIGTKINNQQVNSQFYQNNIAGIGWSRAEAPDLHEIFKSIKTGDIVFLKSSSYSSDITVKGVGVVMDNVILTHNQYGFIEIGRNIKWLSHRHFKIFRPANSKNNVRGNTIYQEFHPDVTIVIMGEVEKML